MNVLITGAGRVGQLGEALAAAFAAHGARLALIDRTPGNVDARAADVRATGGEAHPFACDLTDAAAVEEAMRGVARALGGLDAVVCAAGGFAASGRVDEGERAVWDRMLAVNLTTAHVTTRAALPLLRRSAGSIVYFASPAGLPGGSAKGIAAYAAAKAGVLALMRAVAADERAAHVRANAVALNAVRTLANLTDMGPDARFVEREEVARVVRWLCTEPAVTGQVVTLG